MRSSSSQPASERYLAARARPPRASVSSTTRLNPSRSTARFASSKEQVGARRSSSSPRRSSISSATESRPTRSQSSARPLDRSRASIETAFGSLGVPVAIESRPRLGATAFGQALLSLLRFAWGNGTRRELYAFLRTPYAGLARPDVDFLEGRLRGRAVLRGDRTLEETTKLRNGRPLPMLDLVASEEQPLATARAVVVAMLRNAYGLGAPPATHAGEARPPRGRGGHGSARRAGAPRGRGRVDPRRRCRLALDRATVRGDAAGEPGRVAVLDLGRARTRSFEAVFVIGLEQGSLPRRAPTSPFLDDEARRDLDGTRGARLQRPDPASRDRYLFYTACTRPRRLPDARSRGGDRRRLTARAEPVLGGRLRALRRRRRTASHDPAAARPPDVADRVGADGARAPSRAGAPRSRRPARSRRARVRERLAAQARPGAAGVLATNGPPSSACRGTARQPRDVPCHGSRADGGLLVGLVHRALPPSGRDRPGDRPADARLDRPRRAAAVLQPASVGDSRRRARHDGQPRGGGRAHASLRRQRARLGPPDRRRRPPAARARSGPPPRSRAAGAGGRGCKLELRPTEARGRLQGVRARARVSRSAARSTASTPIR